MARLKVEQTVGNNGGVKEFAYIDITQNNGSAKEFSSTLYQWGRKDAMPGIDAVAEGSFTPNGGDNMSIRNGIQHPETFYIRGASWMNNYNQYNLWSMNNTTNGYNDNPVVKTVYDPCPAGFKMPASNAFTGFTTTGSSTTNSSQINVSGDWDDGLHFNNKINSPDSTVYFPALGGRNYSNGSLLYVGDYGYYWSAAPSTQDYGRSLHFYQGRVVPRYMGFRSSGFSVRPVEDSAPAPAWQYHLNVTSPAAVAYNATWTDHYYIQSYREDPATGTQQPVAWEVVGYQESADGGLTFGSETTTRPAWLTGLDLTQGPGGTTAQTGTATLQAAALRDSLNDYNEALQYATSKGTPRSPYDLSTHDLDGNSTPRNTANSYLISAPGYYRIPLVYGNAIKNGSANPSAYQTANTGTYILTNFKDHRGADITSPHINVQNASDPATQASIVWTDQSGIVTNLSISGSGTGAFVRFSVPRSNLRNGNAVIAVKNASGTVMWSWHLWFAKSDALSTIACTNYQGYTYHVTKQALGFAWRTWLETSYKKPRVARVKVEQTIANGGEKKFAYIDITQNHHSYKEISSTYYQWGRKDALPGIDPVADGSFIPNGGDDMSIQNGIRHPETFYPDIPGNNLFWSYCPINLWSMNNTSNIPNDNPVVKTVYDPCPAGFKMPASNAFTGFTTTGIATNNSSLFNVSGGWDDGWHFNNKINSPDSTVYFPAAGYRDRYSVSTVGYYGRYWLADEIQNNSNIFYGMTFFFDPNYISPHFSYNSSLGHSVRPVKE